MASHCCLWLLMASNGCFWLLMASNGCLWLQMTVYGDLWLKAYGLLRLMTQSLWLMVFFSLLQMTTFSLNFHGLWRLFSITTTGNLKQIFIKTITFYESKHRKNHLFEVSQNNCVHKMNLRLEGGKILIYSLVCASL